MAVILDGKALAKKICDQLKIEIEKQKTSPGLAVILASGDQASSVYVSSKEKKAQSLGIDSYIYRFQEDVSQDEILGLIEKLNKDPKINGILVQLPLFKHLDTNKIINAIDPKKDVDGFHPINLGKLSYGLHAPVCCTPKGIIRLLKEYNIPIESKNVLVIGRSNIVGKPLMTLLINENATVTLAHSKTLELDKIIETKDIIISATGIKHLVKKVKQGAVVVDVGIIRQEDGTLTGDVDFNQVIKEASYITPVPGGVGPMTIACLMENTLELFLEQQC